VYVIYLLFVYFAIKRVVVGRLIVLDHALRQKVMVLRCNISLCADTGTDTLAQTLIREGLAVFQGRHTVYIASKNDIDRISAGLRERYWQQFGVKIIKSRQMAVDGTPQSPIYKTLQGILCCFHFILGGLGGYNGKVQILVFGINDVYQFYVRF
jgi:hypothetical protein